MEENKENVQYLMESHINPETSLIENEGLTLNILCPTVIYVIFVLILVQNKYFHKSILYR